MTMQDGFGVTWAYCMHGQVSIVKIGVHSYGR